MKNIMYHKFYSGIWLTHGGHQIGWRQSWGGLVLQHGSSWSINLQRAGWSSLTHTHVMWLGSHNMWPDMKELSMGSGDRGRWWSQVMGLGDGNGWWECVMRMVTRGGKSQVMESDEWEVAHRTSWHGACKVGLLVIVTVLPSVCRSGSVWFLMPKWGNQQPQPVQTNSRYCGTKTRPFRISLL